jgi:hypothetical protein
LPDRYWLEGADHLVNVTACRTVARLTVPFLDRPEEAPAGKAVGAHKGLAKTPMPAAMQLALRFAPVGFQEPRATAMVRPEEKDAATNAAGGTQQ